MANLLIIDDSDIFRLQLKKTLEQKGHRVLEAQNGFQGIEMIKAHPEVQLILCDVNMPEMDGLTMCQKLKELSLGTNKPILMLTTEASIDMKQRGKQAGVLGWIIKPYKAEKLIEAIEKLTGRNQDGQKS